jgi:hypothetical protein
VRWATAKSSHRLSVTDTDPIVVIADEADLIATSRARIATKGYRLVRAAPEVSRRTALAEEQPTIWPSRLPSQHSQRSLKQPCATDSIVRCAGARPPHCFTH